MPISESFKKRLDAVFPTLLDRHGTPFYLFDERGIIDTVQSMKEMLFTRAGDMNFFAVKACPNLTIMKIVLDNGFGFDCSSPFELRMAKMVGAPPEKVMFSSNDTSPEALSMALEYGCILNLDDISFLRMVTRMPELICFRYNPGGLRQKGSNSIIGDPPDQKFGIRDDLIVSAYRQARDKGAKKFGIHVMYVSNQRDDDVLAGNLEMALDVMERVGGELGIQFEFANVGGGYGIPYRQDEAPLDIVRLGKEYARLLEAFEDRSGYRPKLYAESGRYVTGPHGILVATVINVMEKYKKFVGVDFSELANIMRAAIYTTSYHDISVVGDDVPSRPLEQVDVVGPLCENFRLAKARLLPKIEVGDLIIVNDVGAHFFGSPYNGWPQAKQLLLRADGRVKLIARETTFHDYVRSQSGL